MKDWLGYVSGKGDVNPFEREFKLLKKRLKGLTPQEVFYFDVLFKINIRGMDIDQFLVDLNDPKEELIVRSAWDRSKIWRSER